MIATNVEAFLVCLATANDTSLEIVAAWWGHGGGGGWDCRGCGGRSCESKREDEHEGREDGREEHRSGVVVIDFKRWMSGGVVGGMCSVDGRWR